MAQLIEVFAEVRRVLRSDGTLWLNIGDSYAGSWGAQSREHAGMHAPNVSAISANQTKAARRQTHTGAIPPGTGLKPKDLVGIPWRSALALCADGWYLRSDTIEEVELYCPCGCGHVMEERIWRHSPDREIIWSKPNPMPESVTDRPTRAHEYLFLFTKSRRYFYDADAIREPATFAGPNGAQKSPHSQGFGRRSPEEEKVRQDKQRGHGRRHDGFNDRWDAMTKDEQQALGRNKRSVWTIAKKPFSGWRLGDRRVRVPADAADGDTERITSADCPVHGDHPALAPTASGGGHGDDPSRRSPGSDDRPVPAPRGERAPTDRRPAPSSGPESSGSPDPSCSPAATPHSSRSRKTDRDPGTRQPYTPFARTACRTGDTSGSPASAAPHRGTPESRTEQDDSPDPRESESPNRTVHTSSSSGAPACTCEFYKVSRIDHFATFPPDLVEPCILAGSAEGDTVLDPFAGASTTGLVALRHNRSFIGIELNPDYVELGRRRILDDAPLLNTPAEISEPPILRAVGQ